MIGSMRLALWLKRSFAAKTAIHVLPSESPGHVESAARVAGMTVITRQLAEWPFRDAIERTRREGLPNLQLIA